MIILKYIFYKFYKLLKILDTDKTPEYKAHFLLSMFESFNLLEFYILTSFRTLFTSNKSPLIEEKIMGAIIYSSLFYLNYLLLVKKGRYLKIENRFRAESRKQRIIGTIFVAIYIFLTVFLLFYATYKSWA